MLLIYKDVVVATRGYPIVVKTMLIEKFRDIEIKLLNMIYELIFESDLDLQEIDNMIASYDSAYELRDALDKNGEGESI